MAKDGTNRGGRRVRAEDKPDALAEKIANGSSASIMKFTPPELDGAAELFGEDMPSPGEYLSAHQRDGKPLSADTIYAETWNWLKVRGCEKLVNPRLLDGDRLILCQSNASSAELLRQYPNAEVNPLGYWTGGTDVDTGATNRKLGSDMADSVTGGGLHGKDLSKADVSANIHAFLKAQRLGTPVGLCCAIGDAEIDGIPYSEIVAEAGSFIRSAGSFEKFAEWGLV